MREGKTFFIDTTKCTSCRGCQVACKEWNQLPGEKTINWGSTQNPKDLSCDTWKLVRFTEVDKEKLAWHFFADQCRHCLTPRCKKAADGKAKGAITQDEKTGAVIANPKMKVEPAHFKEIRKACPYDIPRMNSKTATIAFCTMCFDRIKEALLPACVKACPTKAMNFGDRKAMIEMANNRLSEEKRLHKKAMLTDPEDVRAIFLLVDDPMKYHKFAVAEKPIGVKK
ncbi:MAG: formate dehydrogenase [Nitrospirae bacterium]|nr:formate dehydrogenase [Nitrospirota bacterium]